MRYLALPLVLCLVFCLGFQGASPKKSTGKKGAGNAASAGTSNTRSPDKDPDDLRSALPGLNPSTSPMGAGAKAAVAIPVGARLSKISNAMLKFGEQTNPRQFPTMNKGSDGSEPLSWRVQLLPFFDDPKLVALHKKFHLDEPWDSEHNKKLVAEIPDVYVTPEAKQKGKTTFHVFVGDKLIFKETLKSASMNDILDGTSNTLCVVAAGPETATEWTRSGGLPFDPENPFKPLGTLPKNRLWAMFASGEVRNLDATRIPPEILSLLIQHTDGVVLADRINFLAVEDEFRANKKQLSGQLTQLAKAINRYAKEKGRLPPAGMVGFKIAGDRQVIHLPLSWRAHILPYIGGNETFKRFKFNEPSNSSANMEMVDKGWPEVLVFPGAPRPNNATVHVFFGPGAPFVAESTDDTTKVDNPTKTLMLIVVPTLSGKNTLGTQYWFAGGGIAVADLAGKLPLRDEPRASNCAKFGNPVLGGFPIVMFDGTVRLLPAETHRETLLTLINPEGKKTDLAIDKVAPLWK